MPQGYDNAPFTGVIGAIPTSTASKPPGGISAIPVDQAEVPQNDPNARAGYTFDPYSDGCQLADIHSANIPFHNYRQIHVSEVAFDTGFSATTMADAKCPPLWQDVGHYWAAASIAGYLASEFLTKEGLGNKVVGAGGVLAAFMVLKPVLAGFGIAL